MRKIQHTRRFVGYLQSHNQRALIEYLLIMEIYVVVFQFLKSSREREIGSRNRLSEKWRVKLHDFYHVLRCLKHSVKACAF